MEQKLTEENSKIQILEDKIKKLENKNKQLEEELKDERKLVKKLKEKISSQKDLQKIIDSKNKEIEELKSNNNLLYNIKPGEKAYSINFISIDQKIVNYSLICKNTDIFVKLEQQLYEDYPEYKDKETYFMKNATKIKRFKSLEENKIKKNDILTLYIYDIDK